MRVGFIMATVAGVISNALTFAQTDERMAWHLSEQGEPLGADSCNNSLSNANKIKYDFSTLASYASFVAGRDISFVLNNPFKSMSCEYVQCTSLTGYCGSYAGVPLSFHVESGDLYVLKMDYPPQISDNDGGIMFLVFDQDGKVGEGAKSDCLDFMRYKQSITEIGYGKEAANLFVGTSGHVHAYSTGSTRITFSVRIYPKIAKILLEVPKGLKFNFNDVNSVKYNLTKINVKALDVNGVDISIANSEADQWDVDLESHKAKFIPAVTPIVRHSTPINELFPSKLGYRYVTPLVDDDVQLEFDLDTLSD